MLASAWQLKSPISAIIFDCDGTLCSIEGIDELAVMNHCGEIVKKMTREAMDKIGISADLFENRLDLVKPTKDQLLTLGQGYIEHVTPDAKKVIAILKQLKKSIYIISGGLNPAVKIFGKFLEIPSENIFAVDIQFDQEGQYLDFDHMSPLIHKNGKRIVVNQLKQQHPTLAYVGDGLSDYEVYDIPTRFIGYGGAFYRESIAKLCEYYSKARSFSPLLPLMLTENEYKQLPDEKKQLYQEGLLAIQEGLIKC